MLSASLDLARRPPTFIPPLNPLVSEAAPAASPLIASPTCHLVPGLLSVTFRKLPARDIIHLTREAGLQSIEWGGDHHVPHGNVTVAREIGLATQGEGLRVSAYGSYYSAGVSESQGLSFADVLRTAEALRAPAIRVWAGNLGSASCDAEHRARVISDIARITAMAAEQGVHVTLELHSHTLTDTLASTQQILAEVDHPNLLSNWQPPQDTSVADCTTSLTTLLPHVGHVHVFHWWPNGSFVHPLGDGAFAWTTYLKILAAASREIFVSLEFVRGESVPQFQQDASTLLQWLKKLPF